MDRCGIAVVLFGIPSTVNNSKLSYIAGYFKRLSVSGEKVVTTPNTRQIKVYGQVINTTPNLSGSVTGIAVAKKKLYVSHGCKQQIAVYSPRTFQFQQYLHSYCSSCGRQSQVIQCCNCIGNYGSRHPDYNWPPTYAAETYEYDEYDVGPYESAPQQIVGCDINSCLYVSAHIGGGCICKIALGQNSMHSSWHARSTQSNTSSFWPVDGTPHGLSVTSSHNLLVAVSNRCVLQEYSTDGGLIRRIDLRYAGIINPVHCVQLSNNHFAVTHRGSTHQFCIVSSDGQLVQSYHSDQKNVHTPQRTGVRQAGLQPTQTSIYPLPIPPYTTSPLPPFPIHVPAGPLLNPIGGPGSVESSKHSMQQDIRYSSRIKEFFDSDFQPDQSYQGITNQLQGIAVDQRGRILVADQNNNRILVINSQNISSYPLPLSNGCELGGPSSIHFDPAGNRLYIGECNAGRIICCQL